MSAAAGGPQKISIKVNSSDKLQRLDLYLASHKIVELSRNQIQNLVENSKVLVNGKPANKKYKVAVKDKIEIELPLPKSSDVNPENIPIDICFEDEFLAVINKPAGMVVHPASGNYAGTLVNALLYHFEKLSTKGGYERAGIVHRLDKNTSGLLLIAKDDVTQTKLQSALQKRDIKRNYTALVCGHVEKAGKIEAPIGRSQKDRKKMSVTRRSSREAQTKYKLLQRFRTYDLLDVSLHTGRTHQIRVHFAHIGHPVFGDPEYGGREKWHKGIFANERQFAKGLLDIMSRQALHAKRLEFVHPVKGANVAIESDLPSDFRKLLEKLKKEGN
jgi:23S rRNA pseudouridine1911/1915/1917 synthase